MYLGTLCEVSPTRTLFNYPRHPYTQALLSAIPRLNEERPNYIKLKGEVPTPINLPSGCVFHGRCSYATARCIQEIPKLRNVGEEIWVACHAVEEERLDA
jgi:peptide/nickel transport system ATP-binding protein